MHPDTVRLAFREMRPDDLDDMACLLGDPEVMTYYPRPKTRQEAAQWIDCGEFVSVPTIAVTVIEALGAGGALAEVARRVRAETGTQVDVVDFAATLVELGFVARLDGAPLPSMSPEMIEGGCLGATALLAGRVRTVRSAVRWLHRLADCGVVAAAAR